MDKFETLQRSAVKRTETKRPFNRLKAMCSINAAEFLPHDYITRLLENSELKPTFGALLGVLPCGGGTGHALALQKLNTGRYHFFDPNYGVFEMEHDQVVAAVKFLAANSYNFAGPDGKIKGDYTIFGHDGPTPPAIATRLKPNPQPAPGLAALIAKAEPKPAAWAPEPKPEPKPLPTPSQPPSNAPMPKGLDRLKSFWEQKQSGTGNTAAPKKQ